MKWLVMMSPEQLPHAAPAMSGKRRGGDEGDREKQHEGNVLHTHTRFLRRVTTSADYDYWMDLAFVCLLL